MDTTTLDQDVQDYIHGLKEEITRLQKRDSLFVRLCYGVGALGATFTKHSLTLKSRFFHTMSKSPSGENYQRLAQLRGKADAFEAAGDYVRRTMNSGVSPVKDQIPIKFLKFDTIPVLQLLSQHWYLNKNRARGMIVGMWESHRQKFLAIKQVEGNANFALYEIDHVENDKGLVIFEPIADITEVFFDIAKINR